MVNYFGVSFTIENVIYLNNSYVNSNDVEKQDDVLWMLGVGQLLQEMFCICRVCMMY